MKKWWRKEIIFRESRSKMIFGIGWIWHSDSSPIWKLRSTNILVLSFCSVIFYCSMRYILRKLHIFVYLLTFPIIEFSSFNLKLLSATFLFKSWSRFGVDSGRHCTLLSAVSFEPFCETVRVSLDLICCKLSLAALCFSSNFFSNSSMSITGLEKPKLACSCRESRSSS